MNEQVTFSLRRRNPDVLTCIANLSNDEVFTPPEFANKMLDRAATAWADANGGASIWADKSVTFLDPFTKSGVFLREITTRLTEGLKDEIPDINERVGHILTNQVFGIAITQLTAMLARRSVYCSKFANGEHSVANSFTTNAGNIPACDGPNSSAFASGTSTCPRVVCMSGAPRPKSKAGSSSVYQDGGRDPNHPAPPSRR